jgi:AraC-like DNA-binding protein
MSVIPVIHPSASVRDAVRRGVRHRAVKVIACRGWLRLHKIMAESLVDAVVIDLRGSRPSDVRGWTRLYPGVPVFGFSTLRPDDGSLVAEHLENGVAEVLVGGVDDSVLGEVVASRTVTSSIRRELKDAPGLLRLAEPVQLRVWDEVLERVDQSIRTESIADALEVSREHLSREFAAGGAPNLKRVIDLGRLVVAAALLSNPGYRVGVVAGILGYSTASHLSMCSTRIAGVRPGQLAELLPRGVLNRFRRGRTRSRL